MLAKKDISMNVHVSTEDGAYKKTSIFYNFLPSPMESKNVRTAGP